MKTCWSEEVESLAKMRERKISMKKFLTAVAVLVVLGFAVPTQVAANDLELVFLDRFSLVTSYEDDYASFNPFSQNYNMTPPGAGGGSIIFRRPMATGRVTSEFGMRTHNGV